MPDNKLFEVLGAVYKIPIADAESLKKSDGTLDEEKLADLIVDKDKERIAEIKKENKAQFDNGFGAAERKTLKGFDNKLKEKFDIESDLQGDELLDYISETVKSKSDEVKKMTDDDIKSHPLFMQTIKEHKKQLQEKDAEREGALKKLQDENAQKEILSEVIKLADAHLEKIGEVILPSNASKAQTHKDKLYFDPLRQTQWIKKDNKLFPIDKDGKILTDEHNYAMEATDLFEKIAKENLDFKVAKDRSSPDNSKQQQPPTKDQPQKKYTGKAPTSAKEYALLLNDTKNLTPEQRMEIKQTYKEQFSTN